MLSSFKQCCGAESIAFGSGSIEPQIRIVTPALGSAPAPDSFTRYPTLKITFFDLSISNFFMNDAYFNLYGRD